MYDARGCCPSPKLVNQSFVYLKSFISIGTAWSTQYLHIIPTLSCSPRSNNKGSASDTVDVAEDSLSDDEDYGEWVSLYWPGL